MCEGAKVWQFAKAGSGEPTRKWRAVLGGEPSRLVLEAGRLDVCTVCT